MARNKLLPVKVISALLPLFPALSGAQNSVNLQMQDGSPFVAFVKDERVNRTAQSHVTLENIKVDTLLVKIELESGTRYGVTLYLLDKGKPTAGKSFSYILRSGKNKLEPVFMGVRDD